MVKENTISTENRYNLKLLRLGKWQNWFAEQVWAQSPDWFAWKCAEIMKSVSEEQTGERENEQKEKRQADFYIPSKSFDGDLKYV